MKCSRAQYTGAARRNPWVELLNREVQRTTDVYTTGCRVGQDAPAGPSLRVVDWK